MKIGQHFVFNSFFVWTFIGAIAFLCFFLKASVVHAQASVEDLDSGRYTVRPSSGQRAVKSEGKEIVVKSNSGEEINKAEIKERVFKKIEDLRSGPKPVPTSGVVPKPTAPASTAVPPPPATAASPAASEDPEIDLNAYHPEDNRFNIVEVSIAPTISYIDSSSDYWYRRYHSSGPGIAAGTNVWLSPNFGVRVSYSTTLSADIDGDPTSSKATLVDHRYIQAGLLFRRYFSNTRKSPSLVFGVLHDEYNMVVPKSESHRTSVKTTGVALVLRGKFPSSKSKAWVVESTLLPKLKVKEESTGIAIRSGSDDTTYGVKVGIGQEFTMDRKNQVYWKVSHRYEKSVYKGSASTADPLSGATPENITVTTGATIFELGYTWGD